MISFKLLSFLTSLLFRYSNSASFTASSLCMLSTYTKTPIMTKTTMKTNFLHAAQNPLGIYFPSWSTRALKNKTVKNPKMVTKTWEFFPSRISFWRFKNHAGILYCCGLSITVLSFSISSSESSPARLWISTSALRQTRKA